MKGSQRSQISFTIAFIVCFLIINSRCAQLGTVTVTSEPSIVHSTGDLFLLTFLITEIPVGGKIEIQIPDTTSIQQGNVPCEFSEPENYPITCQAVGRTISVALAAGLNGFFQLDITGFTNPPSTTPTDSFILLTKDQNGGVLDEKFSDIVLTSTPGALTSLNLDSDSQRVGEQTDMEFTLTVTHEIPVGGVIKVKFPKWNPNAPPNQILSMIQSSYSCQGIQNINPTLLCTFSNDILRITQGYSNSGADPGDVIKIKVTGVRNPITTSIVSGIWVSTEDPIGGQIDILETSIQVQDPAIISFANISTDNKTVQELGEVKLVFNTPVPLDQGCIIDIIFPSQIPITAIDLTQVEGLMLFGAKRVLNGSINSQDNTYRILDGCDVYKSTDLSAIAYFHQIRNPQSIQQSDSIQIKIRDQSQSLIAELVDGVYLNSESGSFSLMSISAENRVINSLTTVTIKMQPDHKLPIESTLMTRLSSQFTVQNKDELTCQLLSTRILSSNAKCTITDRRIVITDPFDQPYDPFLVGEIEFSIQDVKMPSTAAPTGEFQFTSYIIAENGNDYEVDESLPEDLIRSIPDQITTASVEPDEKITYTTTEYIFTFKAKNDIPREGKVVIELPDQVTIPDFAQTANSCNSIQGFEQNIQCVIQNGGRSIIINDGFKQQSLIAGESLQVSIAGLLNPVSLAPTDSFALHTQTKDGYGIDSIQAGMIIQMDQTLEMAQVLATPSSLVNGAIGNIRFRFIPSSYLVTGDYAVITFPPSLTLPTIPICKGIILLTDILDCVKIGQSQLFIKLGFSVLQGTINAGEIFDIEVQNVKNPPTTQPTESFTFAITNKNNFGINHYSQEVTVATTKAAQMIEYELSQSSREALKEISVSVKFKPIHSIPLNSYIMMQYPQINDINQNNFSCVVDFEANSSCQVISVIDRKIKITGTFDNNAYTAPGEFITVTVTGIVNSEFASESTSFKVETITEQGYKIDQAGNGLILYVDCDFPCQTCLDDNSSQCLTCIQSSEFNKIQDFSCVKECASNRILMGNECKKCDPKCLTCENTQTQCSSCGGDKFPYLSGTFCVDQCPQGFYNDENQNQCLACEAPCDSCEEQPTKCTSCRQDLNLKYLFGNTCNEECPIGLSITNGLNCEACNENCLTCEDTVDQCSSCTATQRLDSKNLVCLTECPDRITIEQNSVCNHCDDNCLTCAGTIDTCTSCPPNLVLTSLNKCKTTCEANDKEIPVAGKCEKCKSPCLTCQSTLENCLSCTPDFYLYEGECLERCPDRYGANSSGVCILEGLKCPLGYEVNKSGDGCTPTIFSCPEGQELNEDRTECRPIGGAIVPFPFFFVILLFILITIASLVKDSRRTKFITSLIAQISILEIFMLVVQIVLCLVNKRYTAMIFTLLALVLLVLSNITFFVFYRRYTMKDSDFQQWSKQYHKTAKILPIFALVINFKMNKFFYSGFFGLDTCIVMMHDPEKNFLKPMRFITIFTFVFVYSLVILADILIIFDVEWGHQLLIIGIETFVTSILLIVLTCCEWAKNRKRGLIGQSEIYMKLRAEPDYKLQSGAPGAEGLMDEDYDTQLRKRALLSIIRQVKKPPIDPFNNNRIDNCHFVVDKQNLRRTESCVEFHELQREFQTESEDEQPKRRRNSFELDSKMAAEYEGRQNIFQNLLQKVLQSQAEILENNVYADSKPQAHLTPLRARKKVTRSTQTYLREIMAIEDETQHSDLEVIIEDEAELDPDYARELIDVVIDGLGDSDANMASLKSTAKRGQLNAKRLQEIPDFELADIMGEFEIDDMGNFIILQGDHSSLLDKHDSKVNRRGYLVDKYGNVVNKQGVIIFKQNELDSDDEIPAPFGFEKRRKQVLSQEAEKKARFQDSNGDDVFVNDEELVENEIRKLTGSQAKKKGGVDVESSVETLMGETPAKYNNQNQGQDSALVNQEDIDEGNQWTVSKDTREIKKPRVKKPREKFRKQIGDQDKQLATAYSGIARGSYQPTLSQQRKKNHEIMPSFDRDVQSKLFKLASHIQSATKPPQVDESMRKEELKQRLEELKNEHFNEMNGYSQQNVFDSPVNYFGDEDEDDKMTERKAIEYSRQPHGLIQPGSTENQFNRQFYPPGPGDSSLGFRDESLMGSRMTNRPKKEHGGGMKKMSKQHPHMASNSKISRIYSNQVASMQANYDDTYSPMGVSADMENQSIQRFVPKHKASVMSSVYQQDLNAQRKASQHQQKKKGGPKFRTLHGKLIDDPEFLIDDDDPNQAERDLIAFKISGQLDKMRQNAWTSSASQF